MRMCDLEVWDGQADDVAHRMDTFSLLGFNKNVYTRKEGRLSRVASTII